MFKKITLIVLSLLLLVPAANATVASSTSRVKYTCSGGSSYAFTFGVGATSEIQVIKTVTATAVETTLTETTDYSISATNNDYSSGGTVNTTAACATGNTITILRNVPLTQDSDFEEGMPTLYETFEDSLDKLTRITQQQQEEINRAPKLPESFTVTSNPMPTPAANNYIGWNASATGLSNLPGPVVTTAAQYEVDALVTYGGGASYTQATIESALTAIGTTNKVTLLLRPGTWVISNNADWSTYTNITFKIVPGVVLSHGSYSLNIPNPCAGPYQWLSGSGLVTFSGSVQDILPQWSRATVSTSAIATTQRIESSAINTALGRFGLYINDLRGPGGDKDPYVEAKRIAQLGVSFVIYYSHAHGNATYQAYDLLTFDALNKAGVGVIVGPFGSADGTNWATYAAVYKDVPNLIGWYVFDEPDGETTIAQQDSTIAAIKAVKNLPCYTSENSWSSVDWASPLSASYDHVFHDLYLQSGIDATPVKMVTAYPMNYLTSLRQFDKVSPGLGAYETVIGNLRSKETYFNAWKAQLDFYQNKTAVFFLWNNDPSYTASPSNYIVISENSTLYDSVKAFIHGYNPSSQHAYVRTVGLAQVAVGYTATDILNNTIAIFDHPKTTGTVSGNGIYLNNGQIAVIDFGRIVTNAAIRAKFVDDTAVGGVFQFIVPDDLTFTSGTVLQTSTQVASGQSQPTTYNTGESLSVLFPDIRSRYLMIKSNTDAGHNGTVYIRSIYISAN